MRISFIIGPDEFIRAIIFAKKEILDFCEIFVLAKFPIFFFRIFQNTYLNLSIKGSENNYEKILSNF